jgi:hypothetical protein
MTLSGPVLFGRYAFAPNRLGYCGPADHQALFEYVAHQQPDRGLLELERRFEGAYPYLKLIAHANDIADPFDRRVVAAYWIGNPLLDHVDPAGFFQSLDERFRKRMTAQAFGWLTSKLDCGARPHHNFHVFDVYTRGGLMHDNHAEIVLETMDSCRISWGTVVVAETGELIVARQPLYLKGGKLALGEPQPARVLRQIDGRGFADEAQPGDVVSIHWNWACEVLKPAALSCLMTETQRSLALANQTM